MDFPPVSARYTLVDDGPGLRLEVPSRKHSGQMVGLALWLIAWYLLTANLVGGALENMLAGFMRAALGPEPSILAALMLGFFLLLWSALWFTGGALGLIFLIWQAFGCEVMQITPLAITITRTVFGLGIPKRYDASRVKRLRVATYKRHASGEDVEGRHWDWSYSTITLTFNYGAAIIRFGDMTRPEAESALEHILQRFPNFGRR